ncbi:Protein CBG20821 [Caenorhabditis briggsae]|uniref:Protein CBG20821 n=1 Tax=Caenorhabditis briggsae TaxID=6238 RepID=A8XYP8_CAEBR|nr:Protein CBG20821 [Caenorhabditis briggsae]CAP37764.2 Protein CBG20821 [Caenorhabditis briggsae]
MAPKRKSARIAAAALVVVPKVTIPKANDKSATAEIAKLKKQLARNKTESTTKLHRAQCDLEYARDELQRNKMQHKLESEKKNEELATLKTEKQALTNEIKHFKNCKDTRKAYGIVQAECKKAEQSRKRMLEAQSLLRAEQEKKFKEAKPWRQCEICTEEFTETGARSPRIMSCGHTFCLTCLESMKETYFRTQIRCPTDRKYMYCKDGDLTKLPINYLALHM